MIRIKQLRLVLPDVLSQLRDERDIADGVGKATTLHTLLQHGRRARLWSADELASAHLDPWQQSLLHALPEDLRVHGLPAAALSWRGEGGDWRAGTWLQVELVHFAAGLDDLRLMFPPLDASDITELMSGLQPLFSLAGFELQQSAASHWYLWSKRQFDLQTYSPRSGFATRVYDVLPGGADGAELRRLMTEVQMLLHQHPLNLQRERRGLPAINAVWFSGAGSPELVTHATAQRVMSNDGYVQALCEHLQISCWLLPDTAYELSNLRDDDVLLVVRSQSLQQLDRDWLLPILQSLVRGRITNLELYMDHWRLTFQGGRWQQLRRKLMSARSAPGATLTDALA